MKNMIEWISYHPEDVIQSISILLLITIIAVSVMFQMVHYLFLSFFVCLSILAFAQLVYNLITFMEDKFKW